MFQKFILIEHFRFHILYYIFRIKFLTYDSNIKVDSAAGAPLIHDTGPHGWTPPFYQNRTAFWD